MKKTVLLVVVLAIAACGGGSDAPNDAPEKCENLVALLCARIISCAPDGTTQAECVAAAKTELACAAAVKVPSGYDACISELGSTPCSVLLLNDEVNLPAICLVE